MLYLLMIPIVMFGLYYFEDEIKDFTGCEFDNYHSPPYLAFALLTSVFWIVVVPIGLLIYSAKKLRERKRESNDTSM